MSLSATLNKRITIQQQSSTQDTWGQPVQTWTDVCTVWASVDDVSGKELIAAQAAQSEITTRIVIRYRDGITSAMRVVHGLDVYAI